MQILSSRCYPKGSIVQTFTIMLLITSTKSFKKVDSKRISKEILQKCILQTGARMKIENSIEL